MAEWNLDSGNRGMTRQPRKVTIRSPIKPHDNIFLVEAIFRIFNLVQIFSLRFFHIFLRHRKWSIAFEFLQGTVDFEGFYEWILAFWATSTERGSIRRAIFDLKCDVMNSYLDQRIYQVRFLILKRDLRHSWTSHTSEIKTRISYLYTEYTNQNEFI